MQRATNPTKKGSYDVKHRTDGLARKGWFRKELEPCEWKLSCTVLRGKGFVRVWTTRCCFMRLIPTGTKERLPKGFSYPLGAEAISGALDGVPQLDSATFSFVWRDEYWASEWRQKLKARGHVKLLEVDHSPLSGERVLRVYSVPSDYSVVARDHLLAELPEVRRKLLVGDRPSKALRIVVTLSLSKAERAANPQGRANGRQPLRSGANRKSAAAASRRSP